MRLYLGSGLEVEPELQITLRCVTVLCIMWNVGLVSCDDSAGQAEVDGGGESGEVFFCAVGAGGDVVCCVQGSYELHQGYGKEGAPGCFAAPVVACPQNPLVGFSSTVEDLIWGSHRGVDAWNTTIVL